MSTLAKRLIGESDYPDDETRTYEITAWPEHLNELERFFWWINSTRSGHSGTASLYVDGDGAARVNISRKGHALKKPEEEIHSKCNGEPEFKACLESKDQVMKVIEATRAEKYMVCPHCKQEIFEKHTYSPDRGITTVHSDCGGKIEFPEPDYEVASWLKPFVDQVKAKKAAGLPLW